MYNIVLSLFPSLSPPSLPSVPPPPSLPPSIFASCLMLHSLNVYEWVYVCLTCTHLLYTFSLSLFLLQRREFTARKMPEPKSPPPIIKSYMKTLAEPFSLMTEERGQKNVAKFNEKVLINCSCKLFLINCAMLPLSAQKLNI